MWPLFLVQPYYDVCHLHSWFQPSKCSTCSVPNIFIVNNVPYENWNHVFKWTVHCSTLLENWMCWRHVLPLWKSTSPAIFIFCHGEHRELSFKSINPSNGMMNKVVFSGF